MFLFFFLPLKEPQCIYFLMGCYMGRIMWWLVNYLDNVVLHKGCLQLGILPWNDFYVQLEYFSATKSCLEHASFDCCLCSVYWLLQLDFGSIVSLSRSYVLCKLKHMSWTAGIANFWSILAQAFGSVTRYLSCFYIIAWKSIVFWTLVVYFYFLVWFRYSNWSYRS